MVPGYDLMVIGAGMAGVAAANKCASAGWRVAIVDALPYGGTCALRGCDPKKILRRGAEIIGSARLMRGKGIGEALLKHLARLAVNRGCGRFEWSVLDWNEGAIRFYEKMGATVMPDWRICRVTGDGLKQFGGA